MKTEYAAGILYYFIKMENYEGSDYEGDEFNTNKVKIATGWDDEKINAAISFLHGKELIKKERRKCEDEVVNWCILLPKANDTASKKTIFKAVFPDLKWELFKEGYYYKYLK